MGSQRSTEVRRIGQLAFSRAQTPEMKLKDARSRRFAQIANASGKSIGLGCLRTVAIGCAR